MMSFMLKFMSAGYNLALAIGQSFYCAAVEFVGEEARIKVCLLSQFDIHQAA